MEILLIIFLGASLGSFAGVLVSRFPDQSIIKPRSHCDSCGKTLEARDLIPLLSSLINRFSCRFCGARIPFYYFLLELTFAISFFLGWNGVLTWTQVFCICLSLVLSLYDLRSQSYPLSLILLAGSVLLLFHPWHMTFLILLLLGIFAQLVFIGIGAGDFYYLALLSLTLDLRQLLWLIQLGCLLAIFVCLKRKDRQPLAFLPFLSLAYLIEITLCQLIN